MNWANVRRLHDVHDRFQFVLAVQPTTTRISYKPCSFRLCMPGTNHDDQSFQKLARSPSTRIVFQKDYSGDCWKVCVFDAYSCEPNMKRKMFPFTWNPRQKCRVHKIVFRSFWLHNRPFTLRMPRANRKIILYRSFSKFAFSRCIRVNKTRNKTLHIHQYGVFTDGQFSQINILGDFKSIGPISSRSKKTPKSFAYQQK